MTRDELVRYVRVVADVFGLRDWEIVVSDEFTDDDDTLADTATTYGQRVARLRFNEHWQSWTPEELRSTVVHELLHVHTESISEVLGDIVGATMDEKAAAATTAAVSYQLERAVDQIAVAIAPYFPLPGDVNG